VVCLSLEEIYEALVNREDIKYVVLCRHQEIVKANLDLENAYKIVEFAGIIAQSAEDALNRVPSMSGKINFFTIYLQSGLALLFVRHGDYSLVVAAMSRKSLDLEKIQSIVMKVKRVLEK